MRSSIPPYYKDGRDLVLNIMADSLVPSWIRLEINKANTEFFVFFYLGVGVFRSSSTASSDHWAQPQKAPSKPFLCLSHRTLHLPSQNFPSSVGPSSDEAAALYRGFHQTYDFPIPLARRTMQNASIPSTQFSDPCYGEEIKRLLQEPIYGSCFHHVPL
ncbi:hypothetical protein EI94DRAFT_1012140 [Lactarius quietus]|nr:hypothetical protein EI94DRAFT_1012140 [Lactarius quietus]